MRSRSFDAYNPGYAGANGQVVKSYMERKLDALRELIEKRNPNVTITMDGRIGFKIFVRSTIKAFLPLSVEQIVSLGMTALLRKTGSNFTRFYLPMHNRKEREKCLCMLKQYA